MTFRAQIEIGNALSCRRIPENAVKTQLWIAVTVYVLIAIVKKRLALHASLYTILQTVSAIAFEKMPLDQPLGASARAIASPNQITN